MGDGRLQEASVGSPHSPDRTPARGNVSAHRGWTFDKWRVEIGTAIAGPRVQVRLVTRPSPVAFQRRTGHETRSLDPAGGFDVFRPQCGSGRFDEAPSG